MVPRGHRRSVARTLPAPPKAGTRRCGSLARAGDGRSGAIRQIVANGHAGRSRNGCRRNELAGSLRNWLIRDVSSSGRRHPVPSWRRGADRGMCDGPNGGAGHRGRLGVDAEASRASRMRWSTAYLTSSSSREALGRAGGFESGIDDVSERRLSVVLGVISTGGWRAAG